MFTRLRNTACRAGLAATGCCSRLRLVTWAAPLAAARMAVSKGHSVAQGFQGRERRSCAFDDEAESDPAGIFQPPPLGGDRRAARRVLVAAAVDEAADDQRLLDVALGFDPVAAPFDVGTVLVLGDDAFQTGFAADGKNTLPASRCGPRTGSACGASRRVAWPIEPCAPSAAAGAGPCR